MKVFDVFEEGREGHRRRAVQAAVRRHRGLARASNLCSRRPILKWAHHEFRVAVRHTDWNCELWAVLARPQEAIGAASEQWFSNRAGIGPYGRSPGRSNLSRCGEQIPKPAEILAGCGRPDQWFALREMNTDTAEVAATVHFAATSVQRQHGDGLLRVRRSMRSRRGRLVVASTVHLSFGLPDG
jgi:hypothetical protein